MIFATGSDLDLTQRWPGWVTQASESEPSWDGRKFRVLRTQESPYGEIIVEAINVD